MSDPIDDSSFEKLGLKLLVSTGVSSVAISKKAWKDFSKFPRKDLLSMQKWMLIWCEGEHHIPPERYKILGRFDGYRIDEFKSFQSRAYGTIATILGGRTFVITAADIKKSDVADPAVLKRAARLAGELKLGR